MIVAYLVFSFSVHKKDQQICRCVTSGLPSQLREQPSFLSRGPIQDLISLCSLRWNREGEANNKLLHPSDLKINNSFISIFHHCEGK